MCTAFQQNYDRGIIQGITQGENYFSRLLNVLLAENRFDDVRRIADDTKYRQELYRKYGILKE